MKDVRRGDTRRRSSCGLLWSMIVATMGIGVVYITAAIVLALHTEVAVDAGKEASVVVTTYAPRVSEPSVTIRDVPTASLPQSKADHTLPSAWALYSNDTNRKQGSALLLEGRLYGNRRAVIPLLLTSTKYHGTSLLATTLQGWILKFLIPQGNIDLIIFYDVHKVALSDLIAILRIRKRPHDGAGASKIDPSLLGKGVTLSREDAELLGDGWFLSNYHATYAFRLHPVILPFPSYLVESNFTQLQDTRWMRCGCPPVCPEKRATVDYIQGTRWYTYDLFLEPIVHPYTYWIKLDVDIWLMREPTFNMVEEMLARGAVFAHTGYIYNGHGCSNELHKAITEYTTQRHVPVVAEGKRWWTQDDTVYYSNFVISSMAFHLSEQHMQLAHALTEYPTGFFKYRWTDQSLFHKVFGVFFGPTEDKFLLDWSHLRCHKKAYHKGAIFYHSKGKKKSSVLRQCTDL